MAGSVAGAAEMGSVAAAETAAVVTEAVSGWCKGRGCAAQQGCTPAAAGTVAAAARGLERHLRQGCLPAARHVAPAQPRLLFCRCHRCLPLLPLPAVPAVLPLPQTVPAVLPLPPAPPGPALQPAHQPAALLLLLPPLGHSLLGQLPCWRHCRRLLAAQPPLLPLRLLRLPRAQSRQWGGQQGFWRRGEGRLRRLTGAPPAAERWAAGRAGPPGTLRSAAALRRGTPLARCNQGSGWSHGFGNEARIPGVGAPTALPPGSTNRAVQLRVRRCLHARQLLCSLLE